MKRNEYLSLSKMHDENEEKMKKLADSQLLENHKKK